MTAEIIPLSTDPRNTAIRRLPDVSLDLSPALRAEFDRMTTVANDLRSSSHSLGHAARCAIAEGLTEDEFAARAAFAYISEGGKPSSPPLAEPPELATQPWRRRAIWRYYREQWTRFHLTPTIRDVARHSGLITGKSVTHHLNKLVTLGLLEHREGQVAHTYRLAHRWR